MGRAGLRRLRHALWRLVRLALARIRPRHGVQDPLDGRRALSGRLVHGAAPADRLALEPFAPSYRHDHRRPRPRDRRAPPADFLALALNVFNLKGGAARARRRGPQRLRPPGRGGGDLHPRDGAAEGLSRGAHLARHLRRGDRCRRGDRQLAAADAGRAAVVLRRLVPPVHRPDPACRARPRTCSTTG